MLFSCNPHKIAPTCSGFHGSIPDLTVKGDRKMNEESNIDPSAVSNQSDTDIVSLLKRMQQQLLSLDRKIDILINQSKEKPFWERPSSDRSFRKRPFSKPLRLFDHSQRRGKGEHEHNPRERDSAQGHYHERRPRQNHRGSNPKKKPFSFKRKNRE